MFGFGRHGLEKKSGQDVVDAGGTDNMFPSEGIDAALHGSSPSPISDSGRFDAH